MPIEIRDWLLTAQERGNSRTAIDAEHPGDHAWSEGNLVRPLIHGATYFAELHEKLTATAAGDTVYFTDWRGDADEQLTESPDSRIERVLAAASERGVDVRGLIWRSHWDKLSFSKEENARMGIELQRSGAEALLDMRVRTGGSHHQKFVVIRYRDHPEDDVAYVGGIDLCHCRRDTSRHDGDPQPQPMSADYGDTPAWHDVQLAIQGPAVHDVETVFRERWTDPTPLSRNPLHQLSDRLRVGDITPDPLGKPHGVPDPVGPHTVQLLRTYPNLRHGRDYPFARGGERSVARGYSKALRRARSLVYIEDQYLWSAQVADQFRDALRDNPELHVVAVLPMVPDQDSALSRIPQSWARWRTIEMLRRAGGDRVHVFGIENHDALPVYVHAKVCVMDDVWASVGSDNFNRRSWTHDSELSAVVIERGVQDFSPYARRLRLALAAEHLDRRVGGAEFDGDTRFLLPGPHGPGLTDEQLFGDLADLCDPHDMVRAYEAAAAALDAWHEGGRRGPRPAGRLRTLPHARPALVHRLWAPLLYRTVHDPDGRPRPLRSGDRY